MTSLCSLNPFAKPLLIFTQQTNQRPRSHSRSPHGATSSVRPILLFHQRPGFALSCSSSQAPREPLNPEKYNLQDESHETNSSSSFWTKWKVDSVEMRSRMAKLGLAAILAYGLFDGVTYTSFFILAFLGYEKSTGKNPAANLQALLGIVLLMWTGNNITRPFRVAGAAALAPLIDKGLKKIQKYFEFPSQIFAFALVATIMAGSCFTIVGLLILSRWGK